MNVDKVWDPVYAPDYSPNLYILAIGGPHRKCVWSSRGGQSILIRSREY